jgi:recombination associated protein RdgC
MWFKQAKIFKLSNTITYTPDLIEEKLKPLAFRPCLPSFLSGHGWASPIDKENAPLVHAANGYILLCLQLEEKVLPAAVVQQALSEKIKQIKADQERNVSRKEKSSLKEELIHSLLPRAFSKLSRIYILLDTKNNWLIIDTASASRLEKCIDLLKKSLGNNTFSGIKTKKVAPLLTRWLLQDDYPDDFSIEKSCVLKDTSQQSRTIRCQEQNLSDKAIQLLLKEGCEAHQLALNWHDKVSFTLTDDFSLKSIRYHEEIISLAKDQHTETQEQQFDADFFIMTETLSELFSPLLGVFEQHDDFVEKNPQAENITAAVEA